MPRFIFSVSLITILIMLLLNYKVFSYQAPVYEKTIVSKGDTLWSIAKDYGGNINKKIFEIKKINNLETSDIYIGQELLIPID
jgi:LysM repeat protein